ncbi:hypothetical protein TCAL_00320 [Tigriopus californicus]|uniref:Ribosome biogenesis protein WDR12 homolog n=2 Tax=Tigriopus californicus TaxID=6832 RepID=A0A553NCC2_TIGCA|nr:hypothetical protein TCAL_00320 [Tigriopus californicus]|eukprot:TCALIF_00320-PA protein Name:"Similar to ISCW009002 Ribosome biogenesis protein WDR12 homolog (Ixodes scapularis)" AED:0.00 eAED:0.00 QI:0/-1/0/1/-1/1/1/0/439
MTAMTEDKSAQIQVKFIASDESLAVPSTTFTVPLALDASGLEQLLKRLLAESHDSIDEAPPTWSDQSFEFVLRGDFLRTSLAGFVQSHEGVTPESVLEIHYFARNPPPAPDQDVNHDDWVSGVSALDGHVLTACYDNTIALFYDGHKLLTIPGHDGPARDVVWISLDEDQGVFASSSHDQTVMLYQWNARTRAIDVMNVCRGHERSVDCLAVDRSRTLLASGSFDTHLKIWSAKLQSPDENGGSHEALTNGSGGESEKKKARTSHKTLSRTPLVTLGGHKEGISGVAWTEDNEVCTSSWDHTLKIWDFEMRGMKTELVGNKSFFGLSYSPLNRTILTCSADRAIRLYDPRSKDGVLVKNQFTSHDGWVTCVDWCQEREDLFISGGHDTVVKMWDRRSCVTPLYDMKGHEDRILCCDWSEKDMVVSGGADNTMKIYKSNV